MELNFLISYCSPEKENSFGQHGIAAQNLLSTNEIMSSGEQITSVDDVITV